MGSSFARRTRLRTTLDTTRTDDGPVTADRRRKPVIQAKLRVGSATDPAEAQADEFADVVMRRLRDRSDHEVATATLDGAIGRIRRRTSGVEVGADGGELSPETERRIASPSGGSPLPGDVRASMGEAIGADLSAVRIHTDATAADLNRTIGARAFTSGNHIHFSSGSFRPSTAEGQHLLAHELGHTMQQGRIRRRHLGGAQMVYRYTDVPGSATWKTDSKEDSSSRSSELKRIDAAVAQYDALRNGTDTAGKRSALAEISDAIFGWESKKDITARKQDAGYRNARKTKVDELKAIVASKSVDSSDEHATELAPLVASYLKHASAGNFDKTRRLGAELYDAHSDLFQRTATQALQSTNNRLWATVFFGVPPKALGTAPHVPSTLKAKPDFNWLTTKWADAAIDSFIIPMSTGTSKTFVMQMLQVPQFRQGLQARATPQTYQRLQDLMPIVRIADAAEVSARTGNQAPTNEQLADAVFAAFLGDQQNSGLQYLTNTVGFDTSKFMLGDATALLRAPCMTLSNLMTEVIKAVVPQNAADGVAVPRSNTKPMLTKPLANIGTNGILTKDASFHGNVKEFGNQVGFQAVNRIFFSNGHEWLQIGNKEYDPTLGISGPIGTVESQVELLFTGTGSKFVSEDAHHKAKAEKVKPPGGKAMKFNRTWKIT